MYVLNEWPLLVLYSFFLEFRPYYRNIYREKRGYEEDYQDFYRGSDGSDDEIYSGEESSFFKGNIFFRSSSM